MLIRYKNSFEKIAMGLLSFMPHKKDVKNLQETIKKYDTHKNWHLYLWKQEESFLGAIGVKIADDRTAVLQHVTVDPSHRNLGIGRKMVKKIREKYGEKYEVIASEDVSDFYQKCLEKDED